MEEKRHKESLQSEQSVNLRKIALDLLMDILEKKVHLDTALHQAFRQIHLPEKRDRSFVNRLVRGTVERMIELDYVIELYSTVKVHKMKAVIRTVLRMSVYQLLYMEQVPASAVCNEAVKLVRKRKMGNLSGFVNGVLRTVLRKKDNIPYPARKDGFVSYAAIRYSSPEWLVKMWEQDLGQEKTEAILQYFLDKQPLSLRYAGEDAKSWEESLKAKGILYEKSPGLSYAYRIHTFETVERIPGYEQGEFAVQDESSMLLSHVAGIKPGMYIIDLCAAPGGKTMHAAKLTGEKGLVSARDLTAFKADKIKENIKRMQLKNVQVKVQDACTYMEEDAGSADIVFADLPCSGLGVIGKKCDIKYRIQPDDFASLQQLQRCILKNALAYVKPGGILMYSTCTVQKGENEEQVAWLLENFDVRPESLGDILPASYREDARGNYLQLLPGKYGTDGFFLAKFRKGEGH